MNFKRANTKVSLLEDYYNHFDEDGRLDTRHGQVEFITAVKYIEQELNDDKNKTILDIGAGTGKYSYSFDKKGYKVTAVELVPHNIEVFKSKNSNVNIYQGNALNLDMLKDDSFDVTLLFGPMYHLLKNEDKIKALEEAKRVTKPNGKIFVSYYMNDYSIITYGFIKGTIKSAIEEGRIDEKFHVVSKEDDLYSMVRIEDIDSFNEAVGLKRISIISQNGASDYIRTSINKLSKEEFDLYIQYHLSICERKDLLGASSHVLDIVSK